MEIDKAQLIAEVSLNKTTGFNVCQTKTSDGSRVPTFTGLTNDRVVLVIFCSPDTCKSSAAVRKIHENVPVKYDVNRIGKLVQEL
jgi:hypothetical protein